MTVLDIGVIIVTSLFVVRGVWIGFVRQIAFFVALVLGYVAAGTYYPLLSTYISRWLENMQLGFVITYSLLFFITYVLVMLGGVLVKKVMQVSFLGWFDRSMGGIFGLAKAVFISTLAFMLISAVFSSTSPMIRKSFFAPYLMESSRILTSVIRDKNLQKELTPKPPAISTFFSKPVPGAKLLKGNAQ